MQKIRRNFCMFLQKNGQKKRGKAPLLYVLSLRYSAFFARLSWYNIMMMPAITKPVEINSACVG